MRKLGFRGREECVSGTNRFSLILDASGNHQRKLPHFAQPLLRPDSFILHHMCGDVVAKEKLGYSLLYPLIVYSLLTNGYSLIPRWLMDFTISLMLKCPPLMSIYTTCTAIYICLVYKHDLVT